MLSRPPGAASMHAGQPDGARPILRRTNRRVFDPIGGYELALLALSRRRLVRAQAGGTAEAFRGRPDGAAGHLIARLTFGRHAAVGPVGAAEAFDSHGLPGTDDQAVQLVRPDGYIAWRGEGLDVAGARAFLSSRLGPGG